MEQKNLVKNHRDDEIYIPDIDDLDIDDIEFERVPHHTREAYDTKENTPSYQLLDPEHLEEGEEPLGKVIGHINQKKELLSVINWFKHSKELKAKGVSIPKGVILFGEPGNGKSLLIKEIIRCVEAPVFVFQVYTDAGYGRRVYSNIEDGYIRMWHPFPEELEIILDVCIEKLSKDERDLRKYSDDQNVVNGYAINSPETDYLPLEHYVALKLGHNLASQYYERGPDFKILVQLDKNGDKYTWHRLTFSVQHSREDHFKDLYAKMFKRVNYELEQLCSRPVPVSLLLFGCNWCL